MQRGSALISRIAVGGESAGGGHAASLAIHARDRSEVPIIFQLLIYPGLDDRTGSTSSAAVKPVTCYRTSSETAIAKIPKTPKDTAPFDPPAYATFSGDDVASISKSIQTGLLQMLR